MPAAAVEVPGSEVIDPVPATDRGRIVNLWKSGGPGLKAAAEVALTGGDADVQRFLTVVGPLGRDPHDA
ncbi:hypothetical protein ADL01_23215 [Streptomyces sp. NRRL WC-3618]|nr:hypothetical protein ADL01_23215 [Streptomyces sp. NRRL WC-3618]